MRKKGQTKKINVRVTKSREENAGHGSGILKDEALGKKRARMI